MESKKYKTNIFDGTNAVIYIKEWEDGDLRLIIDDEYRRELTDTDIGHIIKWVIRFRPNFIKKILETYRIEKQKEEKSTMFNQKTSSQMNFSCNQNHQHEDKKRDQCNQDISHNQDHWQPTLVKQENHALEEEDSSLTSKPSSVSSVVLELLGCD